MRKMTIQSCELPTEGVAIVGRLSARKCPTARKLEEIQNLSYEGDRRLSPYAEHFNPETRVKILCPVLVNGSVELKTMSVRVPIGGALRDPKAHVDNEVEELFLSLGAPQMVLSTVEDDPGKQEGARVYPLVYPALGMQAIDEIRDPNWVPAEGRNLESREDRTRLSESLASGNDMEVPPTDLILAPDNAAVPFDPTLVEGACTSLDEAAITQMYREMKIALLGAEPPDGEGYTKFLGGLRLQLRDALVSAIATIREADDELARNWISLAMIHAATPDAQPVRALDAPGDWLVPADNKFTPMAGFIRLDNSCVQKEAFRSLVVPGDAADQSQAALRVVLLDPIDDLSTLKNICEWAAEEEVVVYVNTAASNLEELARTSKQMPNGTPEAWGKHLVVVGDFFHLSRGEGGSKLSIPAVVARVGLERVLSLRPRDDECDVVTGLAVSAAGHKLLEFDGDAQAIERYQPLRHQRKIEALSTDLTVWHATGGLINVPVSRHDGDGYAMVSDSSFFRSPKRDSPERVFENAAPVRVRNMVVRNIGYFLRKCYVGASMNQASLKELEKYAEGVAQIPRRKEREALHQCREKRHHHGGPG